jgi:hypothetical protein
MYGNVGAAHDDGEDVGIITLPLTPKRVGYWCVFVADELCGVREVNIGAIFQLPNLNLSN